jgi:hypothetical protein
MDPGARSGVFLAPAFAAAQGANDPTDVNVTNPPSVGDPRLPAGYRVVTGSDALSPGWQDGHQ